jgi:peptide/nickel transport system permease protein
MLRYIAHRLLIVVPTLVLISAFTFAVIVVPPGNNFDMYIAELQSWGEGIDSQKVQWLRDQYGLDKPAFQQYLIWVFNLLRGDLGYSFEYGLPVSDIIGDRLLLTVIVTLATVLFIYIVAFPIGVYLATHQHGWPAYVLSVAGLLGLAIPSFLVALAALYLTHRYFGIAIGGLMEREFDDQPWSLAKIASLLAHLLVPTIIIGLASITWITQRLRANLLDELEKPYVATAHAKGLPRLRLLLKYPLRMSLNRFIADVGELLPHLISGAIMISIVMSLPTTGPMLLWALAAKDMYLAASFMMFMALLTIAGVFISDIAIAALDPRIRLRGSATK